MPSLQYALVVVVAAAVSYRILRIFVLYAIFFSDSVRQNKEQRFTVKNQRNGPNVRRNGKIENMLSTKNICAYTFLSGRMQTLLCARPLISQMRCLPNAWRPAELV